MELGIIGLPGSGKTTVFNALTRANRPTTVTASGRLELYSAVVDVPDVRVDVLSKIYNPRKTIYAKVTYTDIAGLDQDLGKTGLTGELRNKIAPMDAFVHVVRAFENELVPHIAGSVNPQRDLETLDGELLLADMVTVENRLARIQESLHKGARGDERKALLESQALFERLHAALNANTPLRDLDLTAEEIAGLHGYSLLTLKPVLVLLNAGEEPLDPQKVITYNHKHSTVLAIQGKLEMEIGQLPPDEAAEFMEEFGIKELALSRVIQASYKLVGLQSFFTVGEDEVRAWNVRVGANAQEAAGVIHTDLARGFIRAEVISYEDHIAEGTMAAARKAGKVRLEGKEYIVQDGDILHIRFSI
ncbi:MAG TPA: redox-regulated ATPase YchF [Anaerolineae bacterium]|nr:redox-regulated ATPase YchF [Anaerolineae bacterium]HQK15634.1 redox-regulated ATPase YchF [Anaerolineae bacterium]